MTSQILPQYFPWSPNYGENFRLLMEISKRWKTVDFPFKMKIAKTFCEAQPTSRVKEFISSPTRQKFPKSLEQKFSYGDIQEYIDSCFQLLRECSVWKSRNAAVQMFFLRSTGNMYTRNFVEWVRFLAVCSSIFFTIMSELRFVKWARFFEQNCLVKWMIFFATFCWLWEFLPGNLKFKDKLQIWDFASFFLWSKFRSSELF